MKPSPLQLERPRSLDEALALLAEHGDDAKVIAGGQSLVPLLNFRLAAPAVLVDLGAVPALAVIEIAEGAVRVGAMCSQRDLERHAAALAACPLLALALPYVGHVATRNRGTVGGSIAHADAAAELPLLLQTLGGEVEVTGPAGARARARRGVLRLAPDELPRARRDRDRGALPLRRRRLGRGLRRGRAAPRRLRRLRASRARCGSEDGVVARGPARRGCRFRPARCGLLAAERALVGTRCEPEALAAAAEEAAAGGRSERRHARLGRVPAPPHRRARRSRCRARLRMAVAA